jgi:hypothetical protein
MTSSPISITRLIVTHERYVQKHSALADI